MFFLGNLLVAYGIDCIFRGNKLYDELIKYCIYITLGYAAMKVTYYLILFIFIIIS